MKILMRLIGLVVVALLVGVAALGVWSWSPDLPREELVARYASEESQFITLVSGETVHARDQGCSDCPAVFLVHGSNASLHTWERWAEQLGENWRVISMDLPGHGLTGATIDGDYSIQRAADIVEEVRAYFGVEQFHIAGNSRGGAVALRYAVDHPDRLSSLGLLNAAGAPWPEADEEDEDGQPFVYALLGDPNVASALKDFLPRPLVEQALRDAFSNQDVVTDAMIDRYYELIRFPGNRQATILRSQMDYDLGAFDRAGELSMPVMIMWGDEDNLVPLALADRFQEAMPHAQRIVYEGVGHTPMEEIAEQSATDYHLFLEAAGSGVAGSSGDFPVHEPGMALFGYFMPVGEIRIGDIQLNNLFLDDAAEADAWQGSEAGSVFAPFMVEFVDTASPWIENELGGGYERGIRVLPQRFAVTTDSVAFEGVSEELGAVSFHGSFDRQAVIDAQGLGWTEDAVMQGRLRIGDLVIEDAAFTWFAGD